MANVKKIIEICIENGEHDTLGKLYGAYMSEDIICGSLPRMAMTEGTREVYEELKQLIPIWTEKYGFNMDTPLSEILEKYYK